MGQEIQLEIKKSIQLSFPTAVGKDCKIFSSPNAEGQWQALGQTVAGNGGQVTVIYNTESDQKAFFKVTATDGGGTGGSPPSAGALGLSIRRFQRLRPCGQGGSACWDGLGQRRFQPHQNCVGQPFRSQHGGFRGRADRPSFSGAFLRRVSSPDRTAPDGAVIPPKSKSPESNPSLPREIPARGFSD